MSLDMLINLQGRLKSSGFSFSVEQFVNAYCMRQRQQRWNINHKYHLNPLIPHPETNKLYQRADRGTPRISLQFLR